jgi:hypothetical protein
MDDYARFVLDRARAGTAPAQSRDGDERALPQGFDAAAAARLAAKKAARKRRRRGD